MSRATATRTIAQDYDITDPAAEVAAIALDGAPEGAPAASLENASASSSESNPVKE